MLLACSHTLAQGRGQGGWPARSCSPCSSICPRQEAHPRSQARAGPWLEGLGSTGGSCIQVGQESTLLVDISQPQGEGQGYRDG